VNYFVRKRLTVVLKSLNMYLRPEDGRKGRIMKPSESDVLFLTDLKAVKPFISKLANRIYRITTEIEREDAAQDLVCFAWEYYLSNKDTPIERSHWLHKLELKSRDIIKDHFRAKAKAEKLNKFYTCVYKAVENDQSELITDRIYINDIKKYLNPKSILIINKLLAGYTFPEARVAGEYGRARTSFFVELRKELPQKARYSYGYL